MANELLKFRRGTYAQIKAEALANGTIYVATDEKALYVDTASERIRIGDFIRINTVKDITPPFSTSSLYYVEADNALLKYTGTEWKQVNGTDDLQSAINTLTNRIANLEGTIGSETTGIVKDINNLKTTVGDVDSGLVKNVAINTSDIENLKRAVGMGDSGEVEGIGAAVAKLSEDLGELAEEVHGIDGEGGIKATIAQHTSDIANNKEDFENLDSTFKTYQTTVSNTYATKDELASEKSVLQKEIDDDIKIEKDRAVLAEQTLSNSIAQNAQDIANKVAKTEFETFKGENTTAIDNAKTASIGAAKEYTNDKIANEITRADEKYATKTSLESTNNIVASHTTALATINGAASVAGSIAEAKAAADNAQNDINSWKTTHSNDYTNKQIDDAVKVAKDAADDAQNSANANAGDIATLKNKVATLETDSATKTELTEAEGRLQKKITDEINAANAMEYKKGVSSEDDLDKETKVKSGDTYVATGAFEFTNGKIVLPGDLLIATGTEVDGIIATPVWEIVHTGYDASLEQELKTVNGKIQLTSKVGEANNGQISFVAEEGSSAKVSVANNVVTIGLMWNDFT